MSDGGDEYADDFHSEEEVERKAAAPGRPPLPPSAAASGKPPPAVAPVAATSGGAVGGRRASGTAGEAAASSSSRVSPAAAGGTGSRGTSSGEGDGWEEIDGRALEVGEQVGGGGFAVVFRGTYRGAPVAVKQIVDPDVSPAQTEEFLRELAVLAGLRHPGIIRLVGARVSPPRQCIVMELAGRSLFAALHEGTAPLSLARRLRWAADAASPLAYLHGRKPVAVIHRDVKSLNYLLALPPPGGAPAPGSPPPCTVRLCDFGLVGSREIDAGTPAYMAPELWGARTFSKAVDVYAFGIMLWELAARAIPFAGWRPADIRDGVVAGERPPLSRLPADAPAELRDLIAACWDGVAARRPDMATVCDTLNRLAAAADAGSVLTSAPPGRRISGGTGSGGGGGGGSGGGGDALDALARGAGSARPGSAAAGARPTVSNSLITAIATPRQGVTM